MLPLSPGALLTIALLVGTAGAAEPRVSECSADPRIDLTVEPAEQAPRVCVNLGAPTTFVFGTPLPPGSAVLSDNRSLGFAQGDDFVTIYPKRSFLPGEQVKLTVRFGDGAAPEETAFWLVGHSAQGARSVDVVRHAHSTETLRREAAEARAEASKCYEEKAQLLAERMEPGGLMGAAWLERTGEIHSKDVFNDLVQHSDNALTVESARIYSHSTGSMAVRLKLLNFSTEPWTATGAVVKSSTGAELGLFLWQEIAIPPGAFGAVVVGTGNALRQLGCPCTLKLWEEQEKRTITLSNVTFPLSQEVEH